MEFTIPFNIYSASFWLITWGLGVVPTFVIFSFVERARLLEELNPKPDPLIVLLISLVWPISLPLRYVIVPAFDIYEKWLRKPLEKKTAVPPEGSSPKLSTDYIEGRNAGYNAGYNDGVHGIYRRHQHVSQGK